MKFIWPLFVFVILASCDQLASEQEITQAQLKQEFEAIQDLINSAACTNDTQCKYIAYGSKACGGPQGYLVYPSSIDQELLERMVARYTGKEDTYNRQHGIMSDCSIQSPPETIGCISGKCVEIQ